MMVQKALMALQNEWGFWFSSTFAHANAVNLRQEGLIFGKTRDEALRVSRAQSPADHSCSFALATLPALDCARRCCLNPPSASGAAIRLRTALARNSQRSSELNSS